jgi:hypothetical protein
MTARQIANAVLALRAERELVTATAADRTAWAAVIRDARVDARTALWAARAHYENSYAEPLTERAWLHALRRVRSVLDQRAQVREVNPREALALARVQAASQAMPCPVCAARPGAHCINQLTGAPYAHGWHHQRTVAPRMAPAR